VQTERALSDSNIFFVEINSALSLSFQIFLQESEIAELAKNSGDSSQKLVYLNDQLREKDRYSFLIGMHF